MKVKALYVVLIVALLIPSAVSAAVCPQVEPLSSVGGGGDFEPMRVAVNGKGNLYVSDRFNKNVRVFDYKGSLLKKIDMTSPLGVAVDGSGRVYIGRAEESRGLFTGEVRVYDANLGALYNLGRGWGEFKYPGAIATDATRVYVADGRANVVKAYDITNGQFLFAFGGYGYCDTNNDGLSDGCGNLVAPTGIYVHPVTGNLYVTDRALFTSDGFNWGMGAGVHIFTRDGAFVKMFGRYQMIDAAGKVVGAKQPGYMIMPASIVIDNSNRIIVSDYSNGYLHVFGDDGSPICLIEQLNFPQGLDFSADGKLLVASLNSVLQRGIDDYVRMSVEPKTLNYDATQCSTISGRNLTISNGGPGALNWSAVSDKSWITVSGGAGSLNGKASASVPVKVDIRGLSAGTHKGSVVVTAQGVEEKVEVVVEVRHLPELKVSPSSLALSVFGSETVQSKLNVEISGSGGTGWSASSSSAWLGVTPPSGPSGALTLAGVTVDTSSLKSGEYSGSVTISADCATGGPVTVPVSLSYIRGGSISITSNVDEASYSIAGPRSYAGSGKTYVLSGLTAGVYTVTFAQVSGFKTPASQGVTVVDGGAVSVAGLYKDLRARNQIIATMGTGKWHIADELRVFDADGRQTGSVTLSSSLLLDRTRSDAMRAGAVTAAADMNGDGKDDFIVANDKGVISGFKADGTPIKGLYFTALPYKAAVDVAVGDIDGDGTPEIIVGAAGAGNAAAVRVFAFKGGAVSDTGINFIAYDNMSGVRVTAGDIDGDGIAEIITAPGGGSGAVKVRLWKADTSKGAGAWTVKDAGTLDAGLSLNGADISSADLDADAVDEIVVVTATSAKTARLRALRANGTEAADFSVAASGSVNVAAGDTDLDGSAEIVLGENSEGLSSVRVYGADGTLRNEFKAFDNIDIFGVKVSLGRMAD